MRLLTILTSLALVSSAAGEQFWVEYDASCGLYPEEVGWNRLAMAGGAERSLEGGVLTLDGLSSTAIVDNYDMLHPMELAPGESFVMQWRVRVDEVHGFADPAVDVLCEGYGRVALDYSETSIYSLFENVRIDFDPHVFHDYSLISTDMVKYSLQIDGKVAHVGQFAAISHASAVGWGDTTSGASSLSSWSYVRFGVVPEPSNALIMTCACLAAFPLLAQRARRNNHETTQMCHPGTLWQPTGY